MFLQRGDAFRLRLKVNHLGPLAAALHLENDRAAFVTEQGCAAPARRYRDYHLADEQGVRMRAGPPAVQTQATVISYSQTTDMCLCYHT